MSASEYRPYVARQVVVQLDGDNAIAGTLDRETAGVLVLTGATLVSTPQPTPMDGDVVINRDRVLWVQVV